MLRIKTTHLRNNSLRAVSLSSATRARLSRSERKRCRSSPRICLSCSAMQCRGVEVAKAGLREASGDPGPRECDTRSPIAGAAGARPGRRKDFQVRDFRNEVFELGQAFQPDVEWFWRSGGYLRPTQRSELLVPGSFSLIGMSPVNFGLGMRSNPGSTAMQTPG